MGLIINRAAVWTTAFALVFVFYAHTFLGVQASAITPIMAALIAIGLGALAFFGLRDGEVIHAKDGRRQLSVLCMVATLALCVIATVLGLYSHDMGLNDWGTAAVQVGTPMLLFFSNQRARLLRAIGVVCVVFALLDLTANILDYGDLAHIARHVGHEGSQVYGLHYLGLAGNALAEGMVAFLAATFIAAELPWASAVERVVRCVLIAVLLYSLHLIGSRSYLGMALVGVPLIGLRSCWRIPPIATICASAAASLYATFNAPIDDYEERLRGWLLQDGFEATQVHPIFGNGITYQDSTDLYATYAKLHAAGVTESGGLDFAIAFGIPALALLVISSLAALGWLKPMQTWPAVLLTLLTASLAFAAPFSFLGATVFWCSLIYCQREERLVIARYVASPSHRPSWLWP